MLRPLPCLSCFCALAFSAPLTDHSIDAVASGACPATGDTHDCIDKEMRLRAPLIIALALACGAASAAPAAWYIWRSKLDGTRVCAQTSPGDGWRKLPTPYRNSRCVPDLP